MRDFLHKIWMLAKPYRVRLLLGVVTGFISGFIEPLTVVVIAFVFGIVFPSNDNSLLTQIMSSAPKFLRGWLQDLQSNLATSVHAHPWAVVMAVMLIPAVVFLRGLFGYLNVYFLQWTAVRAVTDLRVKLFAHLMNLSAGFFNKTSSGELISRVINDTAMLQGVLGGTTAIIVKDPATIIGMLGLLLWRQPQLTLISLLVLPVCAIPIAIFSRKVRRSGRAIQAQSADLMQVMSESFTGSRIVKAYNLEANVTEQFRVSAQKSVSHYMRVVRSMEMPGPMLELFGSLGIAAIMFYLVTDPVKRNPQDLLIFITSIYMMYRPLKNLTRLHSSLEQARAASERVFELLATPNSVPEPAQPRMPHAAGAEIHFDHVAFAYGEKPVLQGINLRVQPGQLVALVGASGSGKTTLANLLLRFYDPAQGAIRIGGIDLREFRTHDLRNEIAVVTQENVLFNESIRRNIELGRPGATNDEIIAAARHAHAHDFIMEKPNGYDTVVGEKGVLLSGGQRQRLAIARAVLKNAPILILDEATNALDTESERAVQAALDELTKGRTTFCIAHRLTTILHADVIVVMAEGRIVETGRHEELIRRGGVYQKLYELQFRD
jgi:subfamily B ATP-binding cassette protein MsbA